jgi:hypothetical protein
VHRIDILEGTHLQVAVRIEQVAADNKLLLAVMLKVPFLRIGHRPAQFVVVGQQLFQALLNTYNESDLRPFGK